MHVKDSQSNWEIDMAMLLCVQARWKEGSGRVHATFPRELGRSIGFGVGQAAGGAMLHTALGAAHTSVRRNFPADEVIGIAGLIFGLSS